MEKPSTIVVTTTTAAAAAATGGGAFPSGIGEILIDRYHYNPAHMRNTIIPCISSFFKSSPTEAASVEFLLREIALALKKQKISLHYFCKIFTVIKYAVSKQCKLKKDATANNRFGEAVIVLTTPYTSHTCTSSISQHRLKRIRTLLSFVDTSTIKLRLEKSLATYPTNPASAFTLCLSVMLARQELSAAATTVLPRFYDEYLVDSRKRDPKHLPLTQSIAALITPDALMTTVLPKLLLLLKRTEDNIDSMISILSALKNDDKYDTSSFACDIVLLHLKPYYFPTNGSTNLSANAAIHVVQLIKSATVLLTITEGITAIISSTNDQRRKIQLLAIFQAIVISLRSIQDADLKQVIKSRIVQCLCDNVSSVQTAENLEMFMNITVDFFAAIEHKNIIVSVDHLSLLKRKLTSASSTTNTNKYTIAGACKFVAKCIEQEACELPSTAIKELIEAISQAVFCPIIKAPTKLVTNTESFLAALEVIARAANSTHLISLPSVELLKKSLKPVIFSEKTFTNKHEFFAKINRIEAHLYFAGLLEIAGFADITSTILSDVASCIPFVNSFVHLVFGCPLKGSTTLQELKRAIEQNKKTPNALADILILGIYQTLRLLLGSNCIEYHIENLKKSIHQLLVLLESMESSTIMSLTNREFIPWIFYHPLTMRQTKTQFQRFISTEEIKNTFSEIARKSMLSNPLILISDHMLQHATSMNREAARMYVKFLFDVGVYEVMLSYCVAFNVANFDVKNAKRIEEFEQAMVRASDELDVSASVFMQALSHLEFKVAGIAKLQYQQQQTMILPKKGQASATIKSKKFFEPYMPTTGHSSFLDDEELKTRRKEELSQRMLHYFRLAYQVVWVFSQIESCSSEIIPQFFFDHFNEQFFELAASKKETSGKYVRILRSILAKYNNTQKEDAVSRRKSDQEKSLAEFVGMLTVSESVSERQVKEYLVFLGAFNAQLDKKAKDAQEKVVSLIRFLHRLNMKILCCEDPVRRASFTMELKHEVLIFYLRLPKEFDAFTSEIHESICADIDSLSMLPITEAVLVKVLQLRKSVGLFFKNILKTSAAAKKCVLSVLLSEKIRVMYSQRFDEIVKLRILEVDVVEEIRQLATKVLAATKQDVTADSINSFDFVQFVVDHSQEIVDKFTSTSHEIILLKPEQQKLIFKKIIEGVQILCSRKVNHEMLSFFPKYLSYHRSTITSDQLTPIFNLIVEKFCDPSSVAMMDTSMQCGIDLIKRFGSSHNALIVSIFDCHLKSNSAEDVHKQLAAIVFLGVCAPYIKNKGLLETVSSKILLLFKNGTEGLQRSLAKCLPDLMNFFDNPKHLIEVTLTKMTSESQVQRKKGHSYLIAGLLKGLGVSFIDKLNLFSHIDEDIDSRKDTSQKESILILITCLLDVLGRVFEPYTPRIITVLMHFFAETNDYIKDLALNATKLLFKTITGYGVKIILPRFLVGLDDSSWRVKYNSIWALGNIAVCSPQQMSSCLPSIVPQLSICLSDTHPKIREIANSSLRLIGSSIMNPEIADITDTLISAHADPFDLNREGLQILIQTQFVHYMDAPSLALVVPIIDYALTQKRDVKPQEHACCVVGNISQLVQKSEDLLPYIDILVRGLRNAITDNDAGVRLFASRAIGQICKTLGDKQNGKFLDFVTALLESKTSTTLERQGAAQALAEIISTRGIAFFEANLQSIMDKIHTKSSSSFIREGYLCVFGFVPSILKENFLPFIDEILEVVSEFVSDDDERTRETALRVLSTFIHIFGESQTQMLVDHISEGLFSINWRRRITSVLLSAEIQEILHKMIRQEQISERQAKQSMQHQKLVIVQQQSSDGSSSHHCNSKQQLSYSNLMGVYVLRSDELEKVQVQATTLWKTCVEESAKILRVGLRFLIEKMIRAICTESPVDTIARTAMASFCVKHGEGLFSLAISHFTEIIEENANDTSSLRGAILVLSEYCKNMNANILKGFEEQLANLLDRHIDCEDNLLRNSVITAIHVITIKTGDLTRFQSTFDRLHTRILKNTASSSSCDCSSHEQTLKTIGQMCAVKSTLFTKYVVSIAFKQPIALPFIEIITNNAQYLGRVVYSLLKEKSGIDILFEEIFETPSGEQRAALIYALSNISIALSSDEDRSIFEKTVIDRITSYSKTYCHYSEDQDHLDVILEILRFHLLQTTSHSLEFYVALIGLVTPFIFEKKQESIVSNSIQILRGIFSFVNRRHYVELLHTFTQSLEDCLASKEKTEKLSEIIGFNCGAMPGDGVRSFIELSTICMVYSPDAAFNESADLFDYVIRYTKVQNLSILSFKLVGPLIRVAHYKLELSEKERVLRLFLQLFSKLIDMTVFVPQLMTTFLKIALDFPPQTKNFQRLLAENLLQVVLLSPRKDLALHAVYSRSRSNNNISYSENILHSEVYLYLTWKLLKFNSYDYNNTLFSKVFIEKILMHSLEMTWTTSKSLAEIKVNAKIIELLSPLLSEGSLNSQMQLLSAEALHTKDLHVMFLNLTKIISVMLSSQSVSFTHTTEIKRVLDYVLNQISDESKEYLLKRIRRTVKVTTNDEVWELFSSFASKTTSPVKGRRNANQHHSEDDDDQSSASDENSSSKQQVSKQNGRESTVTEFEFREENNNWDDDDIDDYNDE